MGCSAKEEATQEESIESVVDAVTEEESDVEEEEEDSSGATSAIELPDSKTLIANTVEEIALIPSGLLTKDRTLDQETSAWASREVPSSVQAEFLEAMRAFLQDEKDPQRIHEALITYLGSPFYETRVEPLITYSPNFKEPLLPEPYEINEGGEREEAPANAIILLDASSSMLLYADGRLKMDTAKNAVSSFADTMGQKSAVSLYAYGHLGTQNDEDKELSCTGIEEIYPLGDYDDESFTQAMQEVEAKGWTPLAGAIAKAREDHQQTTGDITLYIVSDGAETCGGDPIAEAKAFAEAHPDGKVNVIGFQVDDQAESQLQAVAEAGGGSYLAADTLEEMTEQITKLWLPSDIDLISLVYAKPTGWPQTWALDDVRRSQSTLKSIIRVEALRLEGAVSLLVKEGLLDETVGDEVRQLVEEKADRYQTMIENLATEKTDFINQEVDRIVNKIDDYQRRMEELKKEQS